MALKNNWNDLVDGESFVEVDPINRMAHAIIANEENILSVQKLSESIQAENKSQEAEINELSKDLIRFENNAVRLNSKINENEKRITNLEKGIPSDLFLTDSSVAYSKNVPQNALPYAEVRKIGGVTRKCTNLIPSAYRFWASAEVNGITYTANSDGSITLNGTATKTSVIVVSSAIKVKDGTHTVGKISPDTGVFAQLFYKASDGSYPTWNVYNDPVTLDMSAGMTYSFQLAVTEGVTVSNAKVCPMLNEGSTALPYEPYFDGLRSAPVTEVESVGVNLATAQDVYAGCARYLETTLDGRSVVRFCANAVIQNEVFAFKENTQYTVSGWFKNIKTSDANTVPNAYITFYYTDGTANSRTIEQGVDWTYCAGTSTAGKTVAAVGTSMYNYTSDVYVDVNTFMLNKGTAALPYRPYTRHTLPIPESVQALDGYGDGVNESVYNYIDFETKQFVKRVGKVDLGTLDWLYADYYGSGALCFYSNSISDAKFVGAFTAPNALSAPYEAINPTYMSQGGVGFTLFDAANQIALHDPAYTEPATFQAAMQGVMLYYELATPVVTDISDLLSEDNFIGVEGNGTITMINQYKYNVPSEIVFMLNEV